jgi:DNA-binding NarL/FixJ family response regulator
MPKAMRKPSARIVVADDRPLVRKSLQLRIDAAGDLEACGEAGDKEDALKLLKTRRPDLAIVGLRLGGMWGVDLIHEFRTRYPEVTVLVVSTFETYFHAASAMRAGASGFITQQEAPKTIVRAVRQVLAGEMYLDPALAQIAAARLTSSGKSGYALGVDALSHRELQVFELVGIGYDSRRIAEAIQLDISTVDTYRARVKVKLQLQSASEFLQGAIAWVHSRPALDNPESSTVTKAAQ